MTSDGYYGAFVLYLALVGLACWVFKATVMPWGGL